MTEFPHPINPGQPEGTGVKSAGLIGRQYSLFCYAFRSGVMIRMLKMYTNEINHVYMFKASKLKYCVQIFLSPIYFPQFAIYTNVVISKLKENSFINNNSH